MATGKGQSPSGYEKSTDAWPARGCLSTKMRVSSLRRIANFSSKNLQRALSGALRRGDREKALLYAAEMLMSSGARDVWRELILSAAESIGVADAALVAALAGRFAEWMNAAARVQRVSIDKIEFTNANLDGLRARVLDFVGQIADAAHNSDADSLARIAAFRAVGCVLPEHVDVPIPLVDKTTSWVNSPQHMTTQERAAHVALVVGLYTQNVDMCIDNALLLCVWGRHEHVWNCLDQMADMLDHPIEALVLRDLRALYFFYTPCNFTGPCSGPLAWGRHRTFVVMGILLCIVRLPIHNPPQLAHTETYDTMMNHFIHRDLAMPDYALPARGRYTDVECQPMWLSCVEMCNARYPPYKSLAGCEGWQERARALATILFLQFPGEYGVRGALKRHEQIFFFGRNNFLPRRIAVSPDAVRLGNIPERELGEIDFLHGIDSTSVAPVYPPVFGGGVQEWMALVNERSPAFPFSEQRATLLKGPFVGGARNTAVMTLVLNRQMRVQFGALSAWEFVVMNARDTAVVALRPPLETPSALCAAIELHEVLQRCDAHVVVEELLIRYMQGAAWFGGRYMYCKGKLFSADPFDPLPVVLRGDAAGVRELAAWLRKNLGGIQTLISSWNGRAMPKGDWRVRWPDAMPRLARLAVMRGNELVAELLRFGMGADVAEGVK